MAKQRFLWVGSDILALAPFQLSEHLLKGIGDIFDFSLD
jgi:hypothetical protein